MERRPTQAFLTYTADTMARACSGCSSASLRGRTVVAEQHRRMVIQQVTGTADLYGTVFAQETAQGFLASCRACKAGGASEGRIAVRISCGVWAGAFEEKQAK